MTPTPTTSTPSSETRPDSPGSTSGGPRVSVFVTVYNRADLLPDTVRSVLGQTMRDFELVLVDDGSTDGSTDLCRQFAAQDDRVRVVEQENGGIAKAANAGVAACRAALIARLDSDDLMLPTRLQEQADFMDAHPDVVCVGSAVEMIDQRGRFLTVEQRPIDDATIQDHLLRGHCAIANPSCMIRAAALRQAGPYDQSYSPAEDFEMFLRLGEVGELANLSEPLTRYRLHHGSASVKQGRLQRENCRRACELAAQRRGVTRPFEGGELWRPGEDRASQHRYALLYGWWAWNSKQFATATDYAKQALRLRPWSKEAWMLLGKSLGKPNTPRDRVQTRTTYPTDRDHTVPAAIHAKKQGQAVARLGECAA